jgi:hypothetical protein
MIDIVTFDIVPKIEDLTSKIFNFGKSLANTEFLPGGFEQLGFESLNFLLNIGSLYLFLYAFLVFLMISKIVEIFQNKYSNSSILTKARKKLKIKHTTNMALKFIIQSFVEILVSGLLVTHQLQSFNNLFFSFGEILAFITGICCLLIALYLPIHILINTEFFRHL